jgi:sulfatase maturation enzyme AslB (radical SAM superfamily)
MKAIRIPETYNYIACFLTFDCNYRCSYCINYFGKNRLHAKALSGREWVKGLNRIVSRDDLPITLQGGEPSLHPDFVSIINAIKPEIQLDILTNLQFDVKEFARRVSPKRLKRGSPYASIRVSYHPEVMKLDELIAKTLFLTERGFSVGIWGVVHPKYEQAIYEAREECARRGIDFRTKEFLGTYRNKLYGQYKYRGAFDGHNRGVQCKTTEVIIGPDGSIYRCHSDCYHHRNPIGNILDNNFQIKDTFRPCNRFGDCNPCDLKWPKFDRFQQSGHCSVEIVFEAPTRREAAH